MMINFENVELNAEKDRVELAAVSLIREYLARKSLRHTLEVFDEEYKNSEEISLNSRAKLIDYLSINSLHEKNKKLRDPYKTLFELIVCSIVSSAKSPSQNRDRDSSDSYSRIPTSKSLMDKFDSSSSRPKSAYRPSSSYRNNGLDIQDTNEGELYDGTEKRIESRSLKNNDEDYNFKKLSLSSKNKSQDRKPNSKLSSTGSDYSDDKPLSSKNDRYTRSHADEDDDEDRPTRESYKPSKSVFQTRESSSSAARSKARNDDDDDYDMGDRYSASKSNDKRRNSQDYDRNATQASSQKYTNKDEDEDDDKNYGRNGLRVSAYNKYFPGQSKSSTGAESSTNSATANQFDKDYKSTPIDFETAKALRTLLFGNLITTFSDDWKIQSFGFCDYAKLKYGIVQKKGGPCGVLASVQAHLLLELIFGQDESPPRDWNAALFNVSKKDRSKALAKSLANLLWKCGYEHEEAVVACQTGKANFAPSGKYRSDGITESLALIRFRSHDSLENFLIKNIHMFENDGNSGCILLLYSAIFSRTINSILKDMDEQTNRLMGQHGYCTQDMVNLLIHGRAVSNVFNDSVYIDRLELRGPNERNDIGFLSLFEHYKSCEVGSYYKTPKYPVWVVCSESHFSVIFSTRREILNDWKAESRFDLFYYDGLARQDEQIKLTVSGYNYSKASLSFIERRSKPVEKDLTPPLEHVLRTKWKDAAIDWNGSQPIL